VSSGGDAGRWVESSVVFAIHDRQLAEHGGMDGVRDPGLVESALARPANLARYGNPDAADLAAAYAYGIANNHGFLDGNKRTAWVTARLFLADNGRRLEFDPADAIRTMEHIASGRIGEAELAAWFRSRTTQSAPEDESVT
jgi:death-on-curing protein